MKTAMPPFAIKKEAIKADWVYPGAFFDAGRVRAVHGGFTLIEVMVALAITAIALVAGLKAAAALADNAARQDRVLLAQVCAENALIELKLTRQLPGVGDSTLACTQGGRAFEVTRSVRPTPNPNFRRVEAIVRQDAVQVVQVTTLIGRY